MALGGGAAGAGGGDAGGGPLGGGGAPPALSRPDQLEVAGPGDTRHIDRLAETDKAAALLAAETIHAGLSPEARAALVADEYGDRATDPAYSLVRRNSDGKISLLSEGHMVMYEETGKFETTFSRVDEADRAAALELGATQATINRWNQTSNDHDANALAMQRAVRDEFGLTGSAEWSFEAEVAGVDPTYERVGGAYREFARTQYNATQAELSAQGITELTVYRGTSVDNAPPMGDPVTTKLRPSSSWSTNKTVGDTFATEAQANTGNGVLLQGTIPAERVLGVPGKGFGVATEYEVIVLSGASESETWGTGEF